MLDGGWLPQAWDQQRALRDELLNEMLITPFNHASAVLAAWKHIYNTVRP